MQQKYPYPCCFLEIGTCTCLTWFSSKHASAFEIMQNLSLEVIEQLLRILCHFRILSSKWSCTINIFFCISSLSWKWIWMIHVLVVYLSIWWSIRMKLDNFWRAMDSILSLSGIIILRSTSIRATRQVYSGCEKTDIVINITHSRAINMQNTSACSEPSSKLMHIQSNMYKDVNLTPTARSQINRFAHWILPLHNVTFEVRVSGQEYISQYPRTSYPVVPNEIAWSVQNQLKHTRRMLYIQSDTGA